MYDYQIERPKIFTEDGLSKVIKVRDNMNALIESAGAVRWDKATAGVCGDSWLMLAITDYLVETGDFRKITTDTAGQHQVFTK